MIEFKEEGTLSEIGAKVDDLVEHIGNPLPCWKGTCRVTLDHGDDWFSVGNILTKGDFHKFRMIRRAKDAEPIAKPKSKYHRIIRGVTVDVYDLLWAWGVSCPASQHAIKKLLMAGQRGAKDRLTDLQEARDAIDRAIEHEKEAANA